MSLNSCSKAKLSTFLAQLTLLINFIDDNHNFMTADPTIVTPEEITKFRSELADYPEAIAALNVIEECDGYLEDAIPLLLMRETGIEPDRSLNDLLGRCRKFVCQEEVREALESGILAPTIEPIAIGAGFPPGRRRYSEAVTRGKIA